MQRQTRLEMELGGKVRPMLFDHTFFEMLTDGGSLSDIDELEAKRPWRLIPTLALAALKSGAEFENKKDKFDYDEVVRWCAAIEDPLQLNKIRESYKNAMGFIFLANIGRDVIGEMEAKANERFESQLTGMSS